MKSETRSDMLAGGAIGKLLLRLSLPSVVGMLAMSLYNIVDIIFIGKAAGTTGIGALTVVFPHQMLLVAASQCIGIGGGSRISRSMGAGDTEDAGKTFGNMVLMGSITGIFFLTIGLLIPRQLLCLYGATETILPNALGYFHILILSSPIFALNIIVQNAVRAEGNAKAAMTAMIIGTGMNIVLDPIFIFSLDMGIRGAAVATVVSEILAAMFLLHYCFTRRNEFPIGWKYIRFAIKIASNILAVGSASILGAITMNLTTILLNNIVTQAGGDTALASLGIVMRLFIFLISPLSAVNQGLQPIIGYNFGARQYSRVTGSLRIACIFSTLLTTAAAFLFYRNPEFYIRIFTTDPDLLATGQNALRLASIGLPLVGFTTVGGSIFQALGKPASAILASLSRQGVIQIPSALILFMFFGLNGVWLSFPVYHALSFILILILLKRVIKQMALPPTEGIGETDAGFLKTTPSLARLSTIIVLVKKRLLPFD